MYIFFISRYITQSDKGRILVTALNQNSTVLHFIENSSPIFFTETDHTDLDRVFSSFINIDGNINIERAYISLNADQRILNYLKQKNVEIIEPIL
jgi:hypothetical protein